MKLALRLVTIGTAAVLGTALLGCGLISQAKQTVDNLSALGDLADKLDNSQQLTFTADYELVGGAGTGTVVQQPPNSAFIGPQGSVIQTADSLLSCTKPKGGGQTTCQRTPVVAGAQAGDPALMASIMGNGFVSAPMAVTVVTAASLIPGVKVDKSEQDVAGVASTCVHVTGIPEDQDLQSIGAKEFDVCVGDNGVLTSFVGVGTDDVKLGVNLVKFSDTVDPKAFVPPAGAKIVDMTQPS